ncbi:hypothetical protein FB451DRAFT_331888 [Mycena latifolia]|nr:hypothetical protein FB451DRAFT_331888 [Mycena latifolia]
MRRQLSASRSFSRHGPEGKKGDQFPNKSGQVEVPAPMLRPRPLPRPVYFVPRNPRHHLPVYTDFRSRGAQCFILIKNIQGHAPALAKDLSASLFDPTDSLATPMRIEQRSNRLVIKGARPEWKDRVVDWLRARGF